MEQLDAALDAAEASTKIRKAAHDFRILCSTLKIIVWRHHKRGILSVLMSLEEKELVEYVKKVANLGYSLTTLQLRLKVVEMIQCRPIPCAGSMPGWSWAKWFRIRH